MGLVPRLHLGDGMEYAGNALVKNRGGRAYIKIVTMRDTDQKIVAPEVELEKLDKTATSCLKNSSPCNNDASRRVRLMPLQSIIFSVHEIIPYGNFCV